MENWSVQLSCLFLTRKSIHSPHSFATAFYTRQIFLEGVDNLQPFYWTAIFFWGSRHFATVSLGMWTANNFWGCRQFVTVLLGVWTAIFSWGCRQFTTVLLGAWTAIFFLRVSTICNRFIAGVDGNLFLTVSTICNRFIGGVGNLYRFSPYFCTKRKWILIIHTFLVFVR